MIVTLVYLVLDNVITRISNIPYSTFKHTVDSVFFTEKAAFRTKMGGFARIYQVGLVAYSTVL